MHTGKTNTRKVEGKDSALSRVQNLTTVLDHGKAHEGERRDVVIREASHEDLNTFLAKVPTSYGFSHTANHPVGDHLSLKNYI